MVLGASMTVGRMGGQQRGWGEELGLSGPAQKALRGEIEEKMCSEAQMQMTQTMLRCSQALVRAASMAAGALAGTGLGQRLGLLLQVVTWPVLVPQHLSRSSVCQRRQKQLEDSATPPEQTPR